MITNLVSRVALRGFAVAAVLSAASVARAEVVANLGILAIGATELVTCNTTPSCTTTTGTSGGSLPANTAGADPFTHEIVFRVSSSSDTIASTQVLNSTTIDVANMTVALHEVTSAPATTVVGATPTLGAALATASSGPGLGTSWQFFLSYAGLDPAKTYAIQLIGAGAGVQSSAASYAQQVSIVAPVPLPPALLLFGAALAGVIGFARVRRNRKAT